MSCWSSSTPSNSMDSLRAARRPQPASGERSCIARGHGKLRRLPWRYERIDAHRRSRPFESPDGCENGHIRVEVQPSVDAAARKRWHAGHVRRIIRALQFIARVPQHRPAGDMRARRLWHSILDLETRARTAPPASGGARRRVSGARATRAPAPNRHVACGASP